MTAEPHRQNSASSAKQAEAATDATPLTMPGSRDAKSFVSSHMGLVIGTAMLIGIGVVSWKYPVIQWAEAFFVWLQHEQEDYLGKVVICYLLFYAVAAVLCVPAPLLGMSTGLLFSNYLLAVFLVSAGSLSGACLSFFLGRTFFRTSIERRIHSSPVLRALDKAVHREGLKIVFAARFVLPYTVNNYALGVTGVKFWHFTFATWTTGIPFALTYTFIGRDVKELSEIFTAGGGSAAKDSLHTWKLVVVVVGLVAFMSLIYMLTQLAKKAMREAEAKNENEDDAATAQGKTTGAGGKPDYTPSTRSNSTHQEAGSESPRRSRRLAGMEPEGDDAAGGGGGKAAARRRLLWGGER
ncbi:unnamed protein product [Vitrella brassicaformis CCMP3155]|uniref:VTT domain-containing protein n=2 Tax=Vitrella brassicaformis TaxID=1169539 RepID=A0A0G4G050_VITBC|nr:unnamed protein product [Vitrella brassicaformis CCMP3155]|mmetsp:Transcript_32175/g.79723  ORF Transcript_32175/g.79723 Transcript_32175/m.79723 type:complete len:353 (+) Transcript_32175:67-1125(+)|eukprot:CEM21225.1 unnamed protein product [Vitrella brassicaformis CCMP3155]